MIHGELNLHQPRMLESLGGPLIVSTMTTTVRVRRRGDRSNLGNVEVDVLDDRGGIGVSLRRVVDGVMVCYHWGCLLRTVGIRDTGSPVIQPSGVT